MLNKILNTFGTRGLSAVVNFLIAVVISRYLGPDGKGVQGIILTTVAFVLVFSNLVGGATLVYLVPRFRFSLLLFPAYTWSVVISAAAFVLLGTTGLVDHEFVLHISLLSILNSFTNIHSTLLIGREKIRTANLISLIQPLLVIISLLVAFLLFNLHTIEAYLIALYISFGLSMLVSLVFTLREFGIPEWQSGREYVMVIGELFRLGFMNQMAHITQMMSFRLSYYFLELYHGEASVGIYSNGIQIMESIWLISKSISLVQYARIANTDDRKYAQELSLKLLKASIGVSVLCIVPLLLLPESFFLFIFGEGFAGVKRVILILAPGVLVYNISIILGHYFSGTGKYHINTIASGTGLIISIALYIYLIPTYVAAGAGIAASISYAVTSLVVLLFFIREARPGIGRFLPERSDLEDLWGLLPGQKRKNNP